MQRRQQGAAFTPDAMDAYLPRVVATCEAYLQEWASQDSVNLVPAVSGPSCTYDPRTNSNALHSVPRCILSCILSCIDANSVLDRGQAEPWPEIEQHHMRLTDDWFMRDALTGASDNDTFCCKEEPCFDQAPSLQMGELSFDFAEGLVVGLGIQGEEKRILGAKWQEFTKGAITFTVYY